MFISSHLNAGCTILIFYLFSISDYHSPHALLYSPLDWSDYSVAVQSWLKKFTSEYPSVLGLSLKPLSSRNRLSRKDPRTASSKTSLCHWSWPCKLAWFVWRDSVTVSTQRSIGGMCETSVE